MAALTPQAEKGDKDPLDICVISQQRIDRAEIVVPARILGGVQVLDGGEADDKVIGVLVSDTVFDYAKDVKHLPNAVVQRIVHYFATYKMDITGERPNAIEIIGTYGADHAKAVVQASLDDYTATFR